MQSVRGLMRLSIGLWALRVPSGVIKNQVTFVRFRGRRHVSEDRRFRPVIRDLTREAFGVRRFPSLLPLLSVGPVVVRSCLMS